jgi:hypothetical protein
VQDKSRVFWRQRGTSEKFESGDTIRGKEGKTAGERERQKRALYGTVSTTAGEMRLIQPSITILLLSSPLPVSPPLSSPPLPSSSPPLSSPRPRPLSSGSKVSRPALPLLTCLPFRAPSLSFSVCRVGSRVTAPAVSAVKPAGAHCPFCLWLDSRLDRQPIPAAGQKVLPPPRNLPGPASPLLSGRALLLLAPLIQTRKLSCGWRVQPAVEIIAGFVDWIRKRWA